MSKRPLVSRERLLAVAMISAGFLALSLVGAVFHFLWLSAVGLILTGVVFMGAGLVWAGAFVHREWTWRKRQASRDRGYERVRTHFE